MHLLKIIEFLNNKRISVLRICFEFFLNLTDIFINSDIDFNLINIVVIHSVHIIHYLKTYRI